MQKTLALSLALAATFMTSEVYALSLPGNVALNKTVTLSGTFGTDAGPWTTQSPVPAGNLTDGLFEAEGTQWNFGSVWWNGDAHPENYALIDLGGLFNIERFTVQADDNDVYRIEYKVGAGAWQTAWDIPSPGGFGLRTSSTLLLDPIVADYLRFTAIGGDAFYSVSEIQAFGQAVPVNPSEVPLPAALPLMLSGMGVLGFASRRKQVKN